MHHAAAGAVDCGCWSAACGLVHEGYGGVGGRGLAARDAMRDGPYCQKRASELGAGLGAAVYFTCDADFDAAEIHGTVLPYFRIIGHYDTCINTLRCADASTPPTS